MSQRLQHNLEQVAQEQATQETQRSLEQEAQETQRSRVPAAVRPQRQRNQEKKEDQTPWTR